MATYWDATVSFVLSSLFPALLGVNKPSCIKFMRFIGYHGPILTNSLILFLDLIVGFAHCAEEMYVRNPCRQDFWKIVHIMINVYIVTN
jgi:hypothetical protein